MKKQYLFALSLYIISLILVIYYSIQSLIYSTMNPSFPNTTFIGTLVIMISVTFAIGMVVRTYISRCYNPKQAKKHFLVGTVTSWIILLGLFTMM
ncbi:hypothetical protein N782_06450 [Pontibacillus yanchengensis Y32]|uniref:Uncharacterized protein n=1 Tax=Pontibacillus yanchengensis Y32 TaxID=1385514 RepID=A0A0A2TBV5_9BACI|nr:hypothetical protein N782_06450 [Pontibacillus yanchengensis Y32]